MLLKAKDLKNLNQQRKEDLLVQRVHYEHNKETEEFVIQCDLNENFERHVQSYSSNQGTAKDSALNPSGDEVKLEESGSPTTTALDVKKGESTD